ncbi:MAG: hypothetical protein ACXQT5_08480 [Candidatus Syntropharchaeia archaeon]
MFKGSFSHSPRNGEIFGYIVDGFWADVGQPSGYNRAKEWMIRRERTRISDSFMVDGKIYGNVVIDDDAVVLDSVIAGPTMIGKGVTIET